MNEEKKRGWYRTTNWKQRGVEVTRIADDVAGREHAVVGAAQRQGLDLLVDSTGIKFPGDGEWKCK